ncbi:MAG: flavodoxin family protein [bacterium]|nr:flavodoxin family protein [bacterium]
MKYAIVFSSVTGNTRKLAEAIQKRVNTCYFGEPSEAALEADFIFIGFWAQKNSCGADTKKFIESLSGKKVFIFGTAGYNSTKQYFDEILKSVEVLVPKSNTIVGTYMCQGKVSDVMKDRIKQAKPEMYEAIKDNLVEAESHPDEVDISSLITELDKLAF